MNPVINNPGTNPALATNDIADSIQLYQLAQTYSEGASQNLPEARRLFLLSAGKGNAYAMNVLGIMCQYGYGGPIDLKTAGELYNQAIRLGHPQASVNLKCMNLMMKIVFGPYRFEKPLKL